jgi:hypothetical protein
MADLRDFTGKNSKFTGSIGERISSGSTGDRNSSAYGSGTLRFNSTTNLMEYYTGTEWKSIDAPPTITSFTVNGGANVTTASLIKESGTITIVISGSLFDTTGATVLFVGNGGGDVSPITTVRNNSSQITITVNGDSFSNTYEPYDLKVTNGSGLNAIIENCILSDARPAFTTAAGTLGTIGDASRASYTLSSAAATDADGDTITYSITAGSLPAGLSLNSSTGAITGTASAVGSNTTSTFTVSAATATITATRQFSITVNAPQITTYTSGSGTFSVPAGITAVRVLVLAGGGGGGSGTAGGGGAGGFVEVPSFTVSPGSSIPYSVGSGAGAVRNNGGGGNAGGNSTFGTLTAVGGGGGGSGQPGNQRGPQDGGSGGGGSSYGTRNDGAASGNQPGQPGQSGTYGYGYPGYPGPGGGGGGGAGGAGTGHAAGPGRASDITGSSVERGGGGRGQASNPSPAGGAPGGGAGNSGSEGQDGGTNQGGGGGGGWDYGSGDGGAGGPGIIIVRY